MKSIISWNMYYKSAPVNAWNIVLILWLNYLMYEMRWHCTIKAWSLLIHEISSYLKKWKGSTEKLFNISTSSCIPKDKYKFHWTQSPQKLQDFNLYSFIRTSWQNLWYRHPAKLKEQKLPSSSWYLLSLWGTLHSAKTEWLRILPQSCQRLQGHNATTENYAWQAQTWTEPRYQKRPQGKPECRKILPETGVEAWNLFTSWKTTSTTEVSKPVNLSEYKKIPLVI